MNEEIITWRVNERLMNRFLDIKKNKQTKIKKGFAKWLKYIYTYKKQRYETI